MGRPNLLLARNDAKNHFLMVAKSHSLIQAPRVEVVVHDMKKWRLIAPQLETNQLLDEATRVTPALKVGVGTNAADLSQRTCFHAFSRHGHQSPGLEHANVLAELASSGGEGPRLRDRGKFKHLRCVLRPKPDNGKRVISRGNCRVPHQLVSGCIGMYLPARWSRP